jgi:GTP pyrophosphokinase
LKKTWFGLDTIKKEKLPELERQIKTLKRMFLAMSSKDIRVAMIKIIDRLHNMQTIRYLEPTKQLHFAKETLEVFSPMAYRLGMGEIKGRLEDLAFPIVYPKEAEELSKRVKPERIRRQKVVDRAIKILHRHLAKHRIKTLSIHGRLKHKYSLYKKLLRYNGDLSKIYDLIAIRVIVGDSPSRQPQGVDGIGACYQVLGIIHQRWRPLPGRIKDYIALPKPNGYSSLHTTVFGPAGNILEIQIRTPLMHEQAEYGMAAHWQYKEENCAKKYIKKIFSGDKRDVKWLKDLVNIQRSIKDPRELAKVLRLDFFSDRIFVFTPEGDVKDLPVGASPIDFAYAIHSEVGHRYAGAKVDNRIVSADFHLKNGQIVEIIKSKKARPKQDWLDKVKTSNARQKIRRAIRERQEMESKPSASLT